MPFDNFISPSFSEGTGATINDRKPVVFYIFAGSARAGNRKSVRESGLRVVPVHIVGSTDEVVVRRASTDAKDRVLANLRLGASVGYDGGNNENGEESETGRSKLHEHRVCDLACPVKGSHDIVTIAGKIA